MTRDRYRELMMNRTARLTPAEMDEGWFFCCEWDGLLIQKGDPEANCCTCYPQPEVAYD